MPVAKRNNVSIHGSGPRTIVFAHGYGCDQNVWRHFVPVFEKQYRVVLFDQVGAGQSELSQYDPQKYAVLDGYAQDLLEVIEDTKASPAIFVGHSVSAMIGALAAIKRPSAFEHLVMLCPSPCYINDGDYTGGFSREDIDGLLETIDNNYLGWASAMAPVIMGNPDRPELGQSLVDNFCRTDPEIAKRFARVTFLSDCRSQIARISTRTLILACRKDAIVPEAVEEYLRSHIPGSTLVKLQATGHCPHLSAPLETMAALRDYLKKFEQGQSHESH